MKLGELIDSQHVDLTIRDGDLIDGVIVIAKIIEADGTVRLGCAWSEGMDWLTRRGMVESVRDGEADDISKSGDG